MILFVLCSLIAIAYGEITTDLHIVGGEDATYGDYPYQLSFRDCLFGCSHICGAVLISSNYALTAAHCTENYNPLFIDLLCGAHDLGGAFPDTGERTLIPVTFTEHPDWVNDNTRGFPNDIAIIQLDSATTPSTYCSPIGLATGASDFAGTNCLISGWGIVDPALGVAADILQYASMAVQTNAECGAVWENLISPFHICVAPPAGQTGPSACSGDSGGPMTCTEGGNKVVAGVTSWGNSECVTTPSVYTRVSYFKDWICTNTNNEPAGC